MAAPPSMKGSELVVIRNFCRFPPVQASSTHCTRDEPLFYYDVAAATCKPFFNGYCGRSRNRFNSQAECLETCVVKKQALTSEDSSRGS